MSRVEAPGLSGNGFKARLQPLPSSASAHHPERVPTPAARDDYTPAPPAALHSNAGLLILRSFTW